VARMVDISALLRAFIAAAAVFDIPVAGEVVAKFWGSASGRVVPICRKEPTMRRP
jgi:hypothetical protein